ncbi:hypothetical protein RCL1_001158 [Eukaryota sp. TZLM3-RCL]
MPITLNLKSLDELARLAQSVQSPSISPVQNQKPSPSTVPLPTNSSSSTRKKPIIRPRAAPPKDPSEHSSSRSNSPSPVPLIPNLFKRISPPPVIQTDLLSFPPLTSTSTVHTSVQASPLSCPDSTVSWFYDVLSPSSKILLTATKRALSQISLTSGDLQDVEHRLEEELKSSTFRFSKDHPNCLSLRFSSSSTVDRSLKENDCQTDFAIDSCKDCFQAKTALNSLQAQYRDLLAAFTTAKNELKISTERDSRFLNVMDLFECPVSFNPDSISRFKPPKQQYLSQLKPKFQPRLVKSNDLLKRCDVEVEEHEYVNQILSLSP